MTLITFTLCLLIGLGAGDVISSSSLEKCTVYDNGLGGTQSQNCDQRFVVLLSLSGTETSPQIRATLSTAKGSTEGDIALETPISIECNIGRTIVTYPLFFREFVNGNPYEEIITYTSLFDRCSDSRNGKPSCGWALDNAGNQVEDSQGFCCLCEFSDLFKPEDDKYRGDLGCNLFNWASSAHCVRQSTLWYGVYEVGEARSVSDIRCTVTTELRTEEILISTTSPQGLSSSGRVYVKLEGEFNSFALKRSLLSRYILAPMIPSNSPRVLEAKKAWLAVPMTEVGKECDKIGVSFESFRYQANGCGKAPGSCLRLTPEKIRKDEDARVVAGESLQYMLSSFGEIVDIDKTEDNLYVSFYPEKTGVSTSLLSVSIVADDVSFVATESAAKILDAFVEEFTAMSVSGKLHVTIQNFGSLKSSYTVQMPSCSSVVNPITPQTITMGKQDIMQRIFDLSVTTVMSKDLYCDVQVKATQTGRVYDVYRVWFTPRQLVVEPPSDEGGNDSSVKQTIGTPKQCNKSCGINIFCLFSQSQCVLYPILLILVVGGAVVVLVVCLKKVPCCKLCCKALCCFPCRLCKRHKRHKKEREGYGVPNRNNHLKHEDEKDKGRRRQEKMAAQVYVHIPKDEAAPKHTTIVKRAPAVPEHVSAKAEKGTARKKQATPHPQTQQVQSQRTEERWNVYLNVTVTEANKRYIEERKITWDKGRYKGIAIKGMLASANKGSNMSDCNPTQPQYLFTPTPMHAAADRGGGSLDAFRCKLTWEQVRTKISKGSLGSFQLIN